MFVVMCLAGLSVWVFSFSFIFHDLFLLAGVVWCVSGVLVVVVLQ